MAEAVVLNDDNFDSEVISADVPVLVDFWASWCGPCRSMSPIIEEIAASGIVKVGKLNVDEASNTAARYNVMSIPTFVLFRGGKEVKRMIGAMPRDALLAGLGLS